MRLGHRGAHLGSLVRRAGVHGRAGGTWQKLVLSRCHKATLQRQMRRELRVFLRLAACLAYPYQAFNQGGFMPGLPPSCPHLQQWPMHLSGSASAMPVGSTRARSS